MPITEKNILYQLGEIRKKSFAFLENEMKNAGSRDIPPSYGDVLYAIYRKKKVNLKTLSRLTGKDKSTISIIINAAEKKGYVTKEKDNTDNRAIYVRLTQKAENLAGRMMDISEKLKNRLFAGMSEEEKTIFFLLLNKISANLEKDTME